ncbi:MAG: endolytic transglycosylase MltG [bacterium]
MKFIKVIFIFFVSLIIIILISLLYFAFEFNYSSTINSQKQEFEIKEGQGIVQISQNLAREKIYSKPLVFRLYGIYSGKYAKLRAGTYLISPNLSLKKLVNIFVNGDISKGKITIQEGWRINQILDYLIEEGLVETRENFLEVLQASLYKDIDFPEGFEGENLEGLLFPDTYYIQQNAEAEEIIKIMLLNFRERTKDYSILQNNHNLSEYELIILASIIEREAQNQRDRELVASVYLNRVARDMKLEACPTVQYAKSDSWEEIDLNDIQNIISVYNTYLYQGLPPTPIASPSLNSIQAIIDAPKTEYLYFFNNSEGKIFFSKTAQEHETKKQTEL